jgi:hypothetical protein
MHSLSGKKMGKGKKAGASTPGKSARKVAAAKHLENVNDVKVFTENFVLHPEYWKSYKSISLLSWKNVRFDAASRATVPKKPGLYAFAVQPPHSDFPTSSWLFYIGEVGATGSGVRTLWRRYKEYLNELDKNVRKKVGVILCRYNGHVRFYFCELDPGQIDLKEVETSLISALWPEANINDFAAHMRGTRQAFS